MGFSARTLVQGGADAQEADSRADQQKGHLAGVTPTSFKVIVTPTTNRHHHRRSPAFGSLSTAFRHCAGDSFGASGRTFTTHSGAACPVHRHCNLAHVYRASGLNTCLPSGTSKPPPSINHQAPPPTNHQPTPNHHRQPTPNHHRAPPPTTNHHHWPPQPLQPS